MTVGRLGDTSSAAVAHTEVLLLPNQRAHDVPDLTRSDCRDSRQQARPADRRESGQVTAAGGNLESPGRVIRPEPGPQLGGRS